MFFGSYEYTVDQKGRVPLPSKFRGEVGDKLYLLKGYEDCISLYKEEDFRKLIANIQNLPYERAKAAGARPVPKGPKRGGEGSRRHELRYRIK